MNERLYFTIAFFYNVQLYVIFIYSHILCYIL